MDVAWLNIAILRPQVMPRIGGAGIVAGGILSGGLLLGLAAKGPVDEKKPPWTDAGVDDRAYRITCVICAPPLTLSSCPPPVPLLLSHHRLSHILPLPVFARMSAHEVKGAMPHIRPPRALTPHPKTPNPKP